jgi:hypothetical protein
VSLDRTVYHIDPATKQVHVRPSWQADNALTDGGVALEQAERWCDAWELEAALQRIGRSAEFWQGGRRWIDAQRAARKPLPS